MKIKPNGMTIEYSLANPLSPLVYLLFAPTDWNADMNPCKRCRLKKTNPKQ